MSMTAVILLVLKASIVLSVFALGLKATFADATFLFRRPGLLLRALFAMGVLMPCLALILASVFDLKPAVRVALVVISVSPIPPVLPKKALKAGGMQNYTIGLLVAAALLSIVVIPIAMEIFQRISGLPLWMGSGAIAVVMLTTILAPLLSGIVVRKIAATFAERAAKPVATVASLLLVLSALPILIGMGRTMFLLIGDGTLLSLSAFALAGFVIGHLLGGPDPHDRPVLALATASRHPAVALAIAQANFPAQKLAGGAVFLYLVVSGILSALYLAWVGRQHTAGAPESGKPVET